MTLTDVLHNQIAERCDDGNRSKELPEVAHQLINWGNTKNSRW